MEIVLQESGESKYVLPEGVNLDFGDLVIFPFGNKGAVFKSDFSFIDFRIYDWNKSETGAVGFGDYVQKGNVLVKFGGSVISPQQFQKEVMNLENLLGKKLE